MCIKPLRNQNIRQPYTRCNFPTIAINEYSTIGLQRAIHITAYNVTISDRCDRHSVQAELRKRMQHKPRISTQLFVILLIGFLVSSFLPVASLSAAQAEPWSRTQTQQSAQAKLHSELWELAQGGSDRLLPVIIQARNSFDEMVGSVDWTGSTLTRDLHFINAVSAVVPASALLTIAQSPAVKWISPDGPMVSMATTIQSVRDEFDTLSFNNNKGSLNWSSAWAENEPVSSGAGPTTGRVWLDRGALSLYDYPDSGGYPSASRRVDLSKATDAALSFTFATTSGVDWEDAVAVEVAVDGVDFRRLETFTGIGGATIGKRSYDISGFRSANTAIRFRVTSMYGAAYEQFLVDNVQIAFSVEDDAAPPPAYTPTPITGGTVKDDFSANLYTSNDGSRFWAAPWKESLDDNSASSGKVSVGSGYLEMKMDGSFGKRIARTANLAGVNSAQFSYYLLDGSNLNNDDAVRVEASRDAGVNWVALTTINANTTKNQLYTFNLIQALGSVTSSTVVRFRQSAGSGGEKMRLDYVGIAFQYVNPQYDPVFVTWASALGTANAYEWVNGENVIEANGLGPDGLYGYGTDGKAAFGGFSADAIPGHRISKVELLLSAYARKQIVGREVKLRVYAHGSQLSEIKLPSSIFDNYVGVGKAGTVVVDLTASHAWQWLNFSDNLEIYIEHFGFRANNDEYVHYDGIGLRVTAMPGTDTSLDTLAFNGTLPKEVFDASKLTQAFPFAVRAPETWNEAPAYLQGQGMTIAIVDSGVGKVSDLSGRRSKDVNFNPGYHDSKDKYGHGTFVGVIAAGDGKNSNGKFTGIAPKVNLVNVRVSDDQGMSTEGDVLQALQWISANAAVEKIRVVNLSLNASVAQSYHTSPLDAAVELLWLQGIVVVVSGGNNGSANLYPPANSPRVITVGATDDKGTRGLADDVVAQFSAWGTDEVGNVKPDLVAPGTNIIAFVPSNGKLEMGRRHRENAIDKDYFRMSGTSMSAPMVTAAVAMLLQDEPTLTPDQVKYRLKATANHDWPGYDAAKAGAGYLDIYAAIHGTSTNYANEGLAPSELLRPVVADVLGDAFLAGTGFDWSSVNWNSVNWNSVNWNSVNWNSVNWNSGLTWSSVNWNSVNWNSVNWNSDFWDGSFAITQSMREQMMQPIPLETEGVEMDRIFLPTIQQGQ